MKFTYKPSNYLLTLDENKDIIEEILVEENENQRIVDLKVDQKKKIIYCVYPSRLVKMYNEESKSKSNIIKFQMSN